MSSAIPAASEIQRLPGWGFRSVIAFKPVQQIRMGTRGQAECSSTDPERFQDLAASQHKNGLRGDVGFSEFFLLHGVSPLFITCSTGSVHVEDYHEKLKTCQWEGIWSSWGLVMIGKKFLRAILA